MIKKTLILLSCISIIFLPLTTSGQTIEELLPGTDVSTSQYGTDVSVSGNFAVVGAPLENDASGSAYVFEQRDGVWQEIVKLSPDDLSLGDSFGFSVFISGKFIVVGAPAANQRSGSAYVFEQRDGVWQEVMKLSPGDLSPGDSFGFSVSVSGNFVFAGAPLANNETGKVYVFQKGGSSWIESETLIPNDVLEGDKFGFALKVDGNQAIMGAPLVDGARGLVCIYEYVESGGSSKWFEVAGLRGNDIEALDFFGISVDIHADRAIAGSLNESAYTLKKENGLWEVESKIASELFDPVSFGISVAISDAHILIGAPLENSGQGSAYLYTHTNNLWTRYKKISASDENLVAKGFGSTVDLNDNFILVGASSDETESANKVFALQVDQQAGSVNEVQLIQEDFDSGVKPEGWSIKTTNASKTWSINNPDVSSFSLIDPENQFSAVCTWDENFQNEWLFTPPFALESGDATLEFYAGYGAQSVSAAELKLLISTDKGENWQQIWQAENDGLAWTWRKVSLSLSEYSNRGTLHLGWQYAGKDGDLVALDAVQLIAPVGSALQVSEGQPSTPENKAPVISNVIGDQVLTIGDRSFVQDLEDPKVFTDLEGETLYYEIISRDGSVASAERSGSEITITALTPGETMIVISATDQSGGRTEMTFKVVSQNRPVEAPVAVISANPTSGTVPLTVQFEDKSTNEPTKRTWQFGDGNVSEDISVSHTYNQAGTYTVTLSVENDGGRTQVTEQILVFEPFKPPPPQEPSPLVLAEYFVDVDPGFGRGTPVAVKNDSIAEFDVQTPNLEPGFHTVFVRYKDQRGDWGFARGSQFYVAPPAEGVRFPIVKLEYFFDSNDPGVGSAPSVEVNRATILSQDLDLDLGNLDVGEHTIMVRVQNSKGDWGVGLTQTFEVKDPSQNQSPIISRVLSDQSLILGGNPFIVDLGLDPVVFTDPDHDPLIFSAEAENIQIATTTIEGNRLIVTSVDEGETIISVSASDGIDQITTPFQVTVTDTSQPQNLPPIVTALIEDQVLIGGGPEFVRNLGDVFTDEDGTLLKFSVVSSDTAVATATLGGLGVQVIARGLGESLITVAAEDEFGATVSDTFKVTVERLAVATNQPPVIENPLTELNLTIGDVPFVINPYEEPAIFVDLDGDSLSYVWENDGSGIASLELVDNQLIIDPVIEGAYTIRLIASDGRGGTETMEIAVTISAPPIVALVLGEKQQGEFTNDDLAVYYALNVPEAQDFQFTVLPDDSLSVSLEAFVGTSVDDILSTEPILNTLFDSQFNNTITTLEPGDYIVALRPSEGAGAYKIEATTLIFTPIEMGKVHESVVNSGFEDQFFALSLDDAKKVSIKISASEDMTADLNIYRGTSLNDITVENFVELVRPSEPANLTLERGSYVFWVLAGKSENANIYSLEVEEVTAQTLVLNEVYEGSISNAFEEHFLNLTLENGGDFVAQLTTPDSLDTSIKVYRGSSPNDRTDENLVPIALNQLALDAGAYLVVVSLSNGELGNTYQLQVSEHVLPDLALGVEITDEILETEFRDLYRLVIEEEQEIQIILQPEDSLDVTLNLYAGNSLRDVVEEQRIGAAIDAGYLGQPEQTVLNLNTGTYLIEVASSGNIGQYTLTASAFVLPALTVGELQSGTLSIGSDRQFYHLVLDVGKDLQFDVVPQDSLDVQMTVYRGTSISDVSEETFVDGIDLGSGGESETLSRTLEEGAYIIEVGGGVGSFSLQVTELTLPTISVGEQISGGFENANETAFYRLTVSESSDYRVALASLDSLELSLGIYKGGGLSTVSAEQLIQNGSLLAFAGDSTLVDLSLEAGDYVFNLFSFGGDGNYTLSLTQLSLSTLTTGQILEDQIISENESKFYRFTLEDRRQIQIEATPSDDLDVLINLYQGGSLSGSDFNTLIDSRDYGYEGEIEFLELVLPEGSYLVEVGSFANVGPFQLLINEAIVSIPDEATLFSLGDHIKSSLPDAQTRHYYELTPSEGLDVIKLVSSNLDLQMAIYQTGDVQNIGFENLLAQIDESGIGYSEQFLLGNLDVPLIIEVYGFGQTEPGDYALTASTLDRVITRGETQTAQLTPESDLHVYALSLVADDSLAVEVRSEAFDPILYLLPAEANVIGRDLLYIADDISSEDINARLETELVAGDYLLLIASVSGNFGEYDLFVSEGDDSTDPKPPISNLDLIPNVGDGTWALDLDTRNGNQSVQEAFEVKAGDIVVVELIYGQANTQSAGGAATIQFDPSLVAPDINNIEVPTGFLILETKIEDNKLTITFGSLTSVTLSNGHMAQIPFEVLDGFENGVEILLESAIFGDADTFEEITNTPNMSVVLRSDAKEPSSLPDPDFDDDGEVGFSDFIAFAREFGGTDPNYDLDGDGVVNFSDFLNFASNFGKSVGKIALTKSVPKAPQKKRMKSADYVGAFDKFRVRKSLK